MQQFLPTVREVAEDAGRPPVRADVEAVAPDRRLSRGAEQTEFLRVLATLRRSLPDLHGHVVGRVVLCDLDQVAIRPVGFGLAGEVDLDTVAMALMLKPHAMGTATTGEAVRHLHGDHVEVLLRPPAFEEFL
jgi:hypothetical protein